MVPSNLLVLVLCMVLKASLDDIDSPYEFWMFNLSITFAFPSLKSKAKIINTVGKTRIFGVRYDSYQRRLSCNGKQNATV
ncbi:hypothetical protein GUITHDRAFT_152536 [Guillardia theta CCMP2712]|uniref:Secreted protein n=1 Tax=Guillardia theta (strain CCMP2712) TaxID=905079 RepID=L1JC88_GUITC|nr:hypothetical protein GUITHDRAFT_152536 [Guillardia theta CCMP2712]EKX46136.1 hypothetical protein GUITHDRAFT_152536 [Guillardia theta CCMP2712]|eukprot:XP_005833116.1 hypothetical protein GUITHDRAFT_152536 [Guillardia theta CCMP2712]